MKKYLSCFVSVEPYIIWFSFAVQKCKMMISPDAFFIFSKFWFLSVVRGQKMAQNDKRFCLSHSVSQKPYIIYCGFWYTCKIMISQQFFHFFKILIFQVFSRGGVKGQKMTHNYQFQCVKLNIPRTLSRFLVHRCKIMISPGVFFYFLKEYSIANIKILTFFIGPL